MQLRQTGLALMLLAFFTPAFADSCPAADQVRTCHGSECVINQFPGWSLQVYYMDQNKKFTFQKSKVVATKHGKRLNCLYTYIIPETNTFMPPALVLRKSID